MERKLVKQGDNALTITLPAKWLRKYGLRAGESIRIDEDGTKLFISTTNESPVGQLHIDVTGLHPIIRRILAAAYKAGFDALEVTYKTPEELERIQFSIDQEFIGFEIVEQGKNRIVAKKISNIEHSEFTTMLRRTFLFLLQIGDDAVEALKKKDSKELSMIALRDHNINKYTDYCRRAINKKTDVKHTRIAPLYFVVEQIEKIGDAYRDTCLAGKEITGSKQITQTLEELNSFLRQFYEAFYNFELEKILSINNTRNKLKETFRTHFECPKTEEIEVLLNMYIIYTLTFDLNGALMAMYL